MMTTTRRTQTSRSEVMIQVIQTVSNTDGSSAHHQRIVWSLSHEKFRCFTVFLLCVCVSSLSRPVRWGDPYPSVPQRQVVLLTWTQLEPQQGLFSPFLKPSFLISSGKLTVNTLMGCCLSVLWTSERLMVNKCFPKITVLRWILTFTLCCVSAGGRFVIKKYLWCFTWKI